MVTPARRARVRVTGRDAGNVRRVKRRSPVDGEPARASRVRPWKGACHDHLRGRPFLAAAWEPGRIGEPVRLQKGVRLVDAVVDDPDLDPFAARPGDCVQLVGADHAGAGVGGEVVREARIDLAHERQACEPGQPGHGQRDGEAVEDDLEASADARLWDRSQQLSGRNSLGGGDARDVPPRRGGRDVQLACRPERCEASSVCGGQGRKREADDHTHATVVVVGRNHELAAPHPRHAQVAERAPDRHQRRPGGSRRSERRRDRKETHRTAQGTAI